MRGRTSPYLALKDLNLDKWAIYFHGVRGTEVFVHNNDLDRAKEYLYENVSACYSDYEVIGVDDVDELISNKNDEGAT